MRRRPRVLAAARPSRALPAVVLAALLACGPSEPDPAEAGITAARAALERGDASAALAAVREAAARGAASPGLSLAAAEACLGLQRWSETIEHAVAGLALDPGAELTAELRCAEGRAALARFRELGDEADWRRANSSLESATVAGTRRVPSALALVLLQELSSLGSTERMRRFAELLEQIAPGSKEAAMAAERVARRSAAGDATDDDQ